MKILQTTIMMFAMTMLLSCSGGLVQVQPSIPARYLSPTGEETAAHGIDEVGGKFWRVAGYRHGRSFFPLSNYKETKPLIEGELDFQHYHTYLEMVEWFKKWAIEYPDLIDLYIGGRGYSGREIYQLTVTNKKTGKDTDKPAMFIDANRHAGEVTAA